MERLKTTPIIGPIITLLDTYPRLAAWVVLAAGIVGMLLYEAQDVGLSTGNYAALIIASILVAGLCVWIVSWEDEEETPAENVIRVKSEKKPEAPETPSEKST